MTTDGAKALAQAKVTSYRLLLAMQTDASDAIALVRQELKEDIRDDPQRVLGVLGLLLGFGSGLWTLHHGMDVEAATKALEVELAGAIDELNTI